MNMNTEEKNTNSCTGTYIMKIFLSIYIHKTNHLHEQNLCNTYPFLCLHFWNSENN